MIYTVQLKFVGAVVKMFYLKHRQMFWRVPQFDEIRSIELEICILDDSSVINLPWQSHTVDCRKSEFTLLKANYFLHKISI